MSAESTAITWRPSLLPSPATLALLALELAALVVVLAFGTRSPVLTFFLLTVPTIGLFVVVVNLRARRRFPYSAVVHHDAVWVYAAGTPVVTELSRREGSLLKVTPRRRLWLLTIVRPDGTATSPVLLSADVLDRFRTAALAVGWAWQRSSERVEYPPGWEQRLLAPIRSAVPLSAAPHAPARRGVGILVRLGMAAVFLVLILVVKSGVLAWAVLVVFLAGSLFVAYRRLQFGPGRSVEVTPQALRFLYPGYATVVRRDSACHLTLSDSALQFLDAAGQRVCVVRSRTGLGPIREALARNGWPFAEVSGS